MEDKKFIDRVVVAAKFPLFFVVLIWFIHVFSYVTNLNFYWLGIYPRVTEGLKGIVTGPLIHGDFLHLFSNSLPFLILTFIVFFFYKKIAVQSFTLIYLLTGLSVWIFARPSFHIGASGVVYGLVSFVFWSGIFRRNIKSIVLALIVTVLYSGYFLGIVPGEEGVSWESHLMGGIVGIVVAFLFRSKLEKEEIEEKEKSLSSDFDMEGESYYFPPDLFDKKDNLPADPSDRTDHGGFFR
nr:rhomboid family intramembrane serine protease [Saprospiraceae bacterium]